MDAEDLAALDKFVEAVKAACAGGRAVALVELTWKDVAGVNSTYDAVRPFLRIEFSDVPVGEAVLAYGRDYASSVPGGMG